MTDVRDLPSLLLRQIPTLREDLSDDFRIWSDAAPSVLPNADYVFSAMLVPYVVRLLARGDSEAMEKVREIFQLLETLMEDENESVKDTVEVSFCEQFSSEDAAVEKAKHLMGPKVKRAILASSRLL